MSSSIIMILSGLGVVSTIVLLAGILGAGRSEAWYKATFAWLVGAGVNAWMDVSAGAPLMQETTDFVLIFGIPVAAGFVLSRFLKDKVKGDESSAGTH
jgi:hypothetical protein